MIDGLPRCLSELTPRRCKAALSRVGFAALCAWSLASARADDVPPRPPLQLDWPIEVSRNADDPRAPDAGAERAKSQRAVPKRSPGRSGNGLRSPSRVDPDVVRGAYQPLPPTPMPNALPDGPPRAAASSRNPIAIDSAGLVSLHMNDLDLRQALELLSRHASLNILVSPGVQGQVTVNLDRVSLDQALEAILKLGNLTAKKEENLIYVFTPEELVLQGDRGPISTRVYHLNYVRANDLDDMLRPFLSDAGKLTVTPPTTEGIAGGTNLFGGFGAFGGAGGTSGGSGGGGGGGSGGGGGGGGSSSGGMSLTGGNTMAGGEVIIIQDFEKNLQTIDDIIKRLDIQPLQVMVEAVILQVELDRHTNLGINFAVLNGPGRKAMGVVGNGADLATNVGFNPQVVVNGFGRILGNPSTGFPSDTNGFKYGFVDNRVTGFIQALENIGEVNVLASPRVLVLNKQRAEIQLGQRLGYFTATQNLTSTVQQVQFLNTGTLLRFRPFITHDGMIRMEVHPEKSTGEVVANVPSSNTSEVTTNVLVPDGATIVIGGLIENTDSTAQTGVLGLSRLPVVGPLFREKTQDSLRRELIVMLTPRIWNPAGPLGAGAMPSVDCPTPIIGLASPGPGLEDGRAAPPTTPAANNNASSPTASVAASARPAYEVAGRARPSDPKSPAAPTGTAPRRIPADAASSPAPVPAAPHARVTRSDQDPALVRAGFESEGRSALAPVRAAESPVEHKVQRGENFWTISKRYYGSGRYYKALWAANREQVSAPDQLVVGMWIDLPPVDRLDARWILPPTPAAPPRPVAKEPVADPKAVPARPAPRTWKAASPRPDTQAGGQPTP
jgi:general secretion pathway protein D